jgi:stage II sporulation protein D
VKWIPFVFGMMTILEQVRALVLSLGCAAALLAGAAASCAENIRVEIADDQRSVTVRSPSGLRTGSARSRSHEKEVTFRAAGLERGPVRVAPDGAFLQVNGKTYRGAVEVRKKRNGLLLVINDLDLEDYLQGVVAAEIPHEWEVEALKAQAVASRTYAVHQKRNAGKRPYHIRATVDSQMYIGMRGERPRTSQALRETRGQVVLYGGEVIPAFYHASCGGHTEDAGELWGIDEPYLKGVDCDCQLISTYGLWEKRFSRVAVVSALQRQGYRLGDIAGIEIADLTTAGRVRDVRIRHAGGMTVIPAGRLRSTLGNSEVPSIFFEPELVDGEVVLSGRGLGHGVGLCQWGAKELARRGLDYRAILQHYYPGTAIGVL